MRGFFLLRAPIEIGGTCEGLPRHAVGAHMAERDRRAPRYGSAHRFAGGSLWGSRRIRRAPRLSRAGLPELPLNIILRKCETSDFLAPQKSRC
jgi:hypothetical protein